MATPGSTPEKADPSDEAIKMNVLGNLRWDGRVDASRIEATVRDGKVTLTGRVPNYSSRAAAEKNAGMARGVVDVENHLEVQLETGPAEASDADVADRANRVLQWDADLANTDVRAQVQGGVLELEGSVDAHWKTTRARQLVGGIQGVAEVRDNLGVAPTREVADEALAEEIADALERNVLVDEDRVRVQVENGVASLSGEVASWAEASEIMDTASATPGIVDIRQRLEIKA